MFSMDDDLSDFHRPGPSNETFGTPSTSTSKLSALFGDDSAQSMADDAAGPSGSAQSLPPEVLAAKNVLNCEVLIYCPDFATSEYQSKGNGGLALISQADHSIILLIYTQAGKEKNVLTRHLFSPNATLLLIYPYLHFTDTNGIMWSILIDQEAYMRGVFAWYLMCVRSPYPVYDFNQLMPVTAESDRLLIVEGDRLLIGVVRYTIKNFRLVIKDEPDIKLRVSLKKKKYEWEHHMQGLRKGSIRMLYSADSALLLTIKKVRRPDEDTTPIMIVVNKESLPGQVSVAPKKEASLEPQPEYDSSESVESASKIVVERMAALGKPVLPLAPLPPAISPALHPLIQSTIHKTLEETPAPLAPTVKDEPIETEEDSHEVAPTTVVDQPAPATLLYDYTTLRAAPAAVLPPPSYEDFHRVVGIEMDRLQIRLESSFSRMLQESLGPIRDQLTRLENRQEQILQKLEDNRDK